MKAKDVADKMYAVKADLEESARHDQQAAIFVECAWEEFKRVVDLRFGKSTKGVKPQSVLSLRKEFVAWGMAVARKGDFPWLRDSAGGVVFDGLFDAVAKLNGESITIGALMRPEFDPNKLRQGI